MKQCTMYILCISMFISLYPANGNNDIALVHNTTSITPQAYDMVQGARQDIRDLSAKTDYLATEVQQLNSAITERADRLPATIKAAREGFKKDLVEISTFVSIGSCTAAAGLILLFFGAQGIETLVTTLNNNAQPAVAQTNSWWSYAATIGMTAAGAVCILASPWIGQQIMQTFVEPSAQ